MNRGNTLYLECRSGISGDMTVAALLGLGATEENLRRTLEKLPLKGYEIVIGEADKEGVRAVDFDVRITEHTHCHRTWKDIEELLESAELKPRVLELSRRMFQTVAEAEGHVHGKPPEEVHFHEVGAVDSIVDIVGTAACMEELGIEKVLVSALWEGSGHVRCQHGILPVPVPAVLEIAAVHHLTLFQTEEEGEMVTPTGAAIAALSEGCRPERFTVRKTGIGAGKKKFSRANVLRAMLIEEEETEEFWQLESNVDDCSGECLGYTMECLLKAGARDVFFTPVYMKKNRPAYKITVICEEDRIREMDAILFRETTTIGVRRSRVVRDMLKRRICETETKSGRARVKVCETPEGEEFFYPEYEDVREFAQRTGKSYEETYHEIKEAAQNEAEEG